MAGAGHAKIWLRSFGYSSHVRIIGANRQVLEWITCPPAARRRGVLDRNFLDVVGRDGVAGAVVEFGCPGAFVRGDLLGLVERAAIFEVGGDAGRAEGFKGAQ